jgi:nicotinamide phosphoribosyltransferase
MNTFSSNINLPAYGADSYKTGHFKQYPPGTEKIYSYLEARGTNTGYEQTVFYGLQYILKSYLEGKVVTEEDIDFAEEFLAKHFGREDCFNREGWERIVNKHDGRLPLKIRAVPEGTVVPINNVLMTIENTDPEAYWLTNYMETILHQIWYPITVATNSRRLREVISEFYDETCDDDQPVDLQLHDFGYRGVSSVETAALGGSAHLTAFNGTDTLAATALARQYYGAEMAGISIPAAEHSTMTSWEPQDGPYDTGEENAFSNMLDKYPGGLVSVVSDSYDIMRAVENYWGGSLKDEVENFDGVLVIRPDSGDPAVTNVKIFQALESEFGAERNSKGYKVIPGINVIQGDGIEADGSVVSEVLEALKDEGFAASNIAFGSGGGLIQRHSRDDYKFAVKCSSAVVNGKERDVRKTPMEFDEDGNYNQSFKTSKAGELALTPDMETVHPSETDEDLLEVVFEDGEVKREESFGEIRERARK